MRHVLSEPASGSVVRLSPGDWLEVQLSHSRPGFDWEVLDQPGCLVPIHEPRADRPAVLPVGPRYRSLGFLAFGGAATPTPLRLGLVDSRVSATAEVCEVEVVVA